MNENKPEGKRITVCLLSGGLDSCVAATIAKNAGDELYLLSFNWGQAFSTELENAKKISSIILPWEHMILDMKRYNKLSKSLLSDNFVMIPKGNIDEHKKSIPADYPPGRDPTFLMIALSWLESIMLEQINQGENIASGRVLIGTINEDSVVYPDCNPKFYELLNEMLKISTKIGKELKIPIEVQTPFIGMTKKEVLAKGLEIGAPVQHTYSCHKGGEKLCGRCYPCRTIFFAFKDLGADNPFEYETIPEERYS